MEKKNNVLIINQNGRDYYLPNNIIVIGSACVGKSTLISKLIKKFQFYTSIDDLVPLLEVFKLDEYIKNKNDMNIDEKFNIIYCKDILDEYKKYHQDMIPFYSKTAVDGIGYDIIRPELWDKIIRMALIKHGEYNVIEFARGCDSAYDSLYMENPYDRGLKIIFDTIGFRSSIIIYMKSDFELQLKRNYARFMSGNHCDSKEVMMKVYSKDPFQYEITGKNTGVKKCANYSFPVFVIENNSFYEGSEDNGFFMEKLNSIFTHLYPIYLESSENPSYVKPDYRA